MIKVYQIRLTNEEVDAINRDEDFPKAIASVKKGSPASTLRAKASS